MVCWDADSCNTEKHPQESWEGASPRSRTGSRRGRGASAARSTQSLRAGRSPAKALPLAVLP